SLDYFCPIFRIIFIIISVTVSVHVSAKVLFLLQKNVTRWAELHLKHQIQTMTVTESSTTSSCKCFPIKAFSENEGILSTEIIRSF
ncbi:hypothetical protein P3471_23805, partial [Vibrio parahaemolyticus]|nr:hypothetical protein [Vibrio parahaemolyticus]